MNDIALRVWVLKPDISLHLNTGKMTRKFAWCKGSAAYTDLAAESGTSETTGPGWQQVRGPARWDRGRKLGRREIVLSWESLSARCLSLRAWSMIKNVHHAACCSLLASGTKQQAFKPLFSRKHPDRATPDTRRGGFVKLPGNKTWVFTLRFRCRGLLFVIRVVDLGRGRNVLNVRWFVVTWDWSPDAGALLPGGGSPGVENLGTSTFLRMMWTKKSYWLAFIKRASCSSFCKFSLKLFCVLLDACVSFSLCAKLKNLGR